MESEEQVSPIIWRASLKRFGLLQTRDSLKTGPEFSLEVIIRYKIALLVLL